MMIPRVSGFFAMMLSPFVGHSTRVEEKGRRNPRIGCAHAWSRGEDIAGGNCRQLVTGLWALGFGLWALGFGLWALTFGLWPFTFDL
jgi:hypothetical protein